MGLTRDEDALHPVVEVLQPNDGRGPTLVDAYLRASIIWRGVKQIVGRQKRPNVQ